MSQKSPNKALKKSAPLFIVIFVAFAVHGVNVISMGWGTPFQRSFTTMGVLLIVFFVVGLILASLSTGAIYLKQQLILFGFAVFFAAVSPILLFWHYGFLGS